LNGSRLKKPSICPWVVFRVGTSVEDVLVAPLLDEQLRIIHDLQCLQTFHPCSVQPVGQNGKSSCINSVMVGSVHFSV